MTSNRGKLAEGQLKDLFKARESRRHFAWMKLADTYSGFQSAAVCDFLLQSEGETFLLESKEVEHTFRLPKANFKNDQRARMLLWEDAGAKAYLAILFKGHRVGRSLSTPMWRLVPASFFVPLPEGTGSWALSGYPLLTRDELVANLLGA